MEPTTTDPTVDTTKGDKFNTKDVIMESEEDQTVMLEIFAYSMNRIKEETARL
jgi:hypothetical protein